MATTSNAPPTSIIKRLFVGRAFTSQQLEHTLLPKVLALPVFLLAGWSLSGWAIAALLWIGSQAFGLLLSRLSPSADNLAGSGVLAFGMMIRMLAVLVVLLVVVGSDKDVGLAAARLVGRLAESDCASEHAAVGADHDV